MGLVVLWGILNLRRKPDSIPWVAVSPLECHIWGWGHEQDCLVQAVTSAASMVPAAR